MQLAPRYLIEKHIDREVLLPMHLMVLRALLAAFIVNAIALVAHADVWLLSDNNGYSHRTYLGCTYTTTPQPDYWKPFTGRELLDGDVSSTHTCIAWQTHDGVDIDFTLPASFHVTRIVIWVHHFTVNYRIKPVEVYVGEAAGELSEPVAKAHELEKLGRGLHKVDLVCRAKRGRIVRVLSLIHI